MFSTILVATNADRCWALKNRAMATGHVTLLRELEKYPAPFEWLRLMNHVDPELLVLDLEDPAAADCAATTRYLHPNVAVIGVGLPPPRAPECPVEAALPFLPSVEDFSQALETSLTQSQGGPMDNLYAFLPAKAGAGCSTLAVQTALAMANGPKMKRVLLIEADLRSGVVPFMLGLNPERHLQELLAGAAELDAFRFEASLTKASGVDFLLSSREPPALQPGWSHYFRVLNFAQSRYDAILVDLPELVNPGTRRVALRARWVFVVSTPEVLSLKLAERRIQDLELSEVSPDRVRVLLNRVHSREVDFKDVEDLLKRSVGYAFPNDYPAARKALLNGGIISDRSALGRAIGGFAATLPDLGIPLDPRPGRFRDLFSRR